MEGAGSFVIAAAVAGSEHYWGGRGSDALAVVEVDGHLAHELAEGVAGVEGGRLVQQGGDDVGLARVDQRGGPPQLTSIQSCRWVA
nr:hypothetical protein GCM10010200_100050 [Actinomadura rugatobispora]